MSEGAPHPSALKKTIEISTGPMRREGSLLITHHRLALTLVENVCVQASSLNVWNWRTGELLFVREMFSWCIRNLDSTLPREIPALATGILNFLMIIG